MSGVYCRGCQKPLFNRFIVSWYCNGCRPVFRSRIVASAYRDGGWTDKDDLSLDEAKQWVSEHSEGFVVTFGVTYDWNGRTWAELVA